MITAIRKTIVERIILRISSFSFFVVVPICTKQTIVIAKISSRMAVFSEFDSSSFFLFLSPFWLSVVAHEDESAFFDFVRENTVKTPFYSINMEVLK